MLKISNSQMASMEELSQQVIVRAFRPALQREFGADAVGRAEPLKRLVEAAVAAKLDRTEEIRRFLRVCCALEADDATPARRMLVVRLAQQPIAQSERLDRMERVALVRNAGGWPAVPSDERSGLSAGERTATMPVGVGGASDA